VVGVQVMQGVQEATVESAGQIPSYGYAYLVGAVVAMLGAAVALAIRSSDRGETDDTLDAALAAG
jgi:hypothetical protein